MMAVRPARALSIMTSPPSVSGVRPGDVLAGKYRVDRVLGAGGMGIVVAAHHIGLDERVAIKFLLPEMLAHGEAVARFAREARAAVKIKSDHVARVSDVGTLENGAPYIVMEYLEGGDLSAWLKQHGALPLEQAIEFVLQACEAIAEAHALGIVHRDLKPANLFVIRRPDGALSVKVLDFGISKMRGVGSSVPDVSITKTSAMMGSPLYMSPEQMQSAKDVDSRTDIWALGIILYELVSGESPFMAEGIPELVAKIISMPPPPLRARKPDLPAGFEAVIERCLAKDRNQRFESVGELAHALLPYAPRRSRLSIDRISGVMRAAGFAGGATALPPSSDPTEGGAGGTQAAFGRTKAPPGRAKVTLLVGVALTAAGAGVFFSFRPAPTSPAAEPLATAAAAPIAAEAPRPAPPARAPTPEVATPAKSPADAPSAEPPAAAPASRTTRPAAAPKPVVAPVATPAPAPAPLPPPTAATVQARPAPVPAKKGTSAFDDRK
jgi:serine/threonine-protein kinase